MCRLSNICAFTVPLVQSHIRDRLFCRLLTVLLGSLRPQCNTRASNVQRRRMTRFWTTFISKSSMWLPSRCRNKNKLPQVWNDISYCIKDDDSPFKVTCTHTHTHARARAGSRRLIRDFTTVPDNNLPCQTQSQRDFWDVPFGELENITAAVCSTSGCFRPETSVGLKYVCNMLYICFKYAPTIHDNIQSKLPTTVAPPTCFLINSCLARVTLVTSQWKGICLISSLIGVFKFDLISDLNVLLEASVDWLALSTALHTPTVCSQTEPGRIFLNLDFLFKSNVTTTWHAMLGLKGTWDLRRYTM